STDVGARIVAALTEKILGKPMVVVNKAGAGGQVGWTDMARQKPDGYYIGYINLPATNTVILDPERKAIFGIDAFVPIINQVLDPGIVWVRADSPYKTLKDLVDAAKKAPNTIRTATTGILSDDHLAVLKGTPQAVLKKLEAVLRKAMEDPEHVQKLESAGLAIKIMVGEEYARYYRDAHVQAKKYTEWAKSRPHK